MIPTQTPMRATRGYFGVGVQGISKSANAGALFRSAHAFGASFVFSIAPAIDLKEARRADTSESHKQLPLYVFPSVAEMSLPRGCRLVGVELMDDAIDLPSFRHPEQAAYVLGPEKGSLSPDLVAACDFVVKIPTRFCVNVSVAGAILMYDRLTQLTRFADRPVRAGGPTEPLAPHVHGRQVIRRRKGASAQDGG